MEATRPQWAKDNLRTLAQEEYDESQDTGKPSGTVCVPSIFVRRDYWGNYHLAPIVSGGVVVPFCKGIIHVES
jgi:hypothetical protein